MSGIHVDPAVEFYDPKPNDYDLAKDPRCLWGWGPPTCNCMFGHSCRREFGHPGQCDDSDVNQDAPCNKSQRPKDWDSKGRAEANR